MASNKTFGFPANNSNFSVVFGHFQPKIAMFSIIQNISYTKVAGNKKVLLSKVVHIYMPSIRYLIIGISKNFRLLQSNST